MDSAPKGRSKPQVNAGSNSLIHDKLTISAPVAPRLDPHADLTPLAGIVGLECLATEPEGLSPFARRWHLEELRPITELTHLDLRDTHIADLRPLKAMVKLERFFLQGTDVTDLGPLAGLPKLTTIELRRTATTDPAPLAAEGGWILTDA